MAVELTAVYRKVPEGYIALEELRGHRDSRTA
jgi:hypothetical protein